MSNRKLSWPYQLWTRSQTLDSAVDTAWKLETHARGNTTENFVLLGGTSKGRYGGGFSTVTATQSPMVVAVLLDEDLNLSPIELCAL